MELTNNLETEIFTIISQAGEAKGIAYEALTAAHEYDFQRAEELMKKCSEAMDGAHNVQTKLIQAELNGKGFEKSLLLIHAQDHLMTSISEQSMIEQMILLLKKVHHLENK